MEFGPATADAHSRAESGAFDFDHIVDLVDHAAGCGRIFNLNRVADATQSQTCNASTVIFQPTCRAFYLGHRNCFLSHSAIFVQMI